jgi:hypothetical protein
MVKKEASHRCQATVKEKNDILNIAPTRPSKWLSNSWRRATEGVAGNGEREPLNKLAKVRLS